VSFQLGNLATFSKPYYGYVPDEKGQRIRLQQLGEVLWISQWLRTTNKETVHMAFGRDIV
jgi:hypothetical protein